MAFSFLCLFACSSSNENKSSPNHYQPVYQYPNAYQPPVNRRDGYYYSPRAYRAPSSYYSNPYAFPPQNNYPYYDGDQYYVPPSYYGTGSISDNQFPGSVNQKF